MHHSPLLQPVLHLLLTATSVFIVAKLMPGIRVRSFGYALAFAFVVGAVNYVTWLVLSPIALPIKFLTLGLAHVIVNVFAFLLAGRIVAGIQISGCFTALFASLAVSFVNGILRHLLLGNK